MINLVDLASVTHNGPNQYLERGTMINSPELNSIASSFRGWQIILSLSCGLLFCRLKIIMVFFQSGQDEKWCLICDRSSKIMKNLIFWQSVAIALRFLWSLIAFTHSDFKGDTPSAHHQQTTQDLTTICMDFAPAAQTNTSLCSKQGSWLPFLSPLVYPLCPKFPAAVPQMEMAFSTLLSLSPLMNIVDAFTERWWWLKYKRGRNTTNHLNV